MNTILIAELIYVVLITLVIFMRPYQGLVLLIATLPIADILPQVPLVSSISPLIGALTLVAYLFRPKKRAARHKFHLSITYTLAIVLIWWIFIINPQSAWFSLDRNWVLTFVQLLVLVWLGGNLLDTPRKHQVLMWVFSITSLISAVIAITQGGFGEIDPELEVGGLAQGANTAARYFIISFVFLNYLRTTTKNRILRLLAAAGMITTFLGVFYSVSKTAMVILALVLILLIFWQSRFKYRLQIGIISAVAIAVLIFFSSSVLGILEDIVPAVTEGSDTMGVRYALWDAGFEMWQDHPITGVGIGMYVVRMKEYPNPIYPLQFRKGAVAHNMYIAMLSETGIIGFGLFMALLIKSLSSLWRARRYGSQAFKPIATVWLIVFIAMLLGGITKTDQVDKLLWLTMGVSVFFEDQLILQRSSKPVDAKSGAVLQAKDAAVNSIGFQK